MLTELRKEAVSSNELVERSSGRTTNDVERQIHFSVGAR